MTRSHCNKCSKTFPLERRSLTGSRAPYGFKPPKRQNSPLAFNHKRLWLLAFDGFIALALGYVIVVRCLIDQVQTLLLRFSPCIAFSSFASILG